MVLLFRSPGCRKFPVLVKSPDDVILAATKFVSERLCPIFQVFHYDSWYIVNIFVWITHFGITGIKCDRGELGLLEDVHELVELAVAQY